MLAKNGLNFEIIRSKLPVGLDFKITVILTRNLLGDMSKHIFKVIFLYVLQETRNPPKVVENQFWVSGGD